MPRVLFVLLMVGLVGRAAVAAPADDAARLARAAAGQPPMSIAPRRPVQTRMVPGGQGVPIALTEWGNPDGSGVLLIHGFLASTLNWQKQVDGKLGDRFRMAALDMRGHGASAKPWDGAAYLTTGPWADDVDAAIKAAGLRKPVIVAWSYGGFFAMDYVRHYGTSNIAGIVLVGNTAGLLPAPDQGPPTPERLEQIRRSRTPYLHELSEWTDGYLKFLMASGPLPPKEAEILKVSAMLAPHYIRPFLRERPTNNTDLVTKLDVPLLFIAGGADNSVPMKNVTEISAKLARSRVAVYEGLGNMMFWYAPDRFDSDVAGFVSEVNGSAEIPPRAVATGASKLAGSR